MKRFVTLRRLVRKSRGSMPYFCARRRIFVAGREVETMVVVKNINNNVSLCMDGNGKEVVVLGKGVGFIKPPAQVPLGKIERTFYHVNSHYLGILQEVPQEVLDFTARQMTALRDRLPYETTANLTFVLADHLAFALERARKNIYIPMPSAYELETGWPLEMEVGRDLVKTMEQEFKVRLPHGEAQAIAMHFINARSTHADETVVNIEERYEEILERTTQIIEEEMALAVRRDSFNYARFATHVQYLLRRIFEDKSIDSENIQMYQSVREEYEAASRCVDKIAEYLKRNWKAQLTEEEKLYLIMHVNRVCAKEREE